MIDYEGLAQTEYVGPVGYEKKAHKTHFTVKDKWKHNMAYFDGYLMCTECEWIGTIEVSFPEDDIPEDAIEEFNKHKE